MTRRMLTEAEEKERKEVDTLMEGWMSKAAEDHRRLADRFEKIGLTQEDLQNVGEKVDHSQQMRSSGADFMRSMFAKLDAVYENQAVDEEMSVDEADEDDQVDEAEEVDEEDKVDEAEEVDEEDKVDEDDKD